jgi:hypothetical protein
MLNGGVITAAPDNHVGHNRPELRLAIGAGRVDQRRADPVDQVVASLVGVEDGSGRGEERRRVGVLLDPHH